MDILTNPFHILGASTLDSRGRIVELANEKSLTEDETVVRKARMVLTNPRKRLAAEMAWMPGVPPGILEQAIRMLRDEPEMIPGITDMPVLAQVNLLAEGLVRAEDYGLVGANNDVATWIVLLANSFERLDADDIVEGLNRDRSQAGMPPISSADSVENELRSRRAYIRKIIQDLCDGWTADALIDVANVALKQATRNGHTHAPVIVDDFVDIYETRIEDELKKATSNVQEIVEEMRAQAGNTSSADVFRLKKAVKNWDEIAQPIQLSYRGRGLSHKLSLAVYNGIRNLAVHLHNEFGQTDLARRITAILQRTFAEIDRITEQLDEDESALEKVAWFRQEQVQPVGALSATDSGATAGSDWMDRLTAFSVVDEIADPGRGCCVLSGIILLAGIFVTLMG